MGGDSKLGATNLLAAKEVADGFDSLTLEVQIRFEVELHGVSSRLASMLHH